MFMSIESGAIIADQKALKVTLFFSTSHRANLDGFYFPPSMSLLPSDHVLPRILGVKEAPIIKL